MKNWRNTLLNSTSTMEAAIQVIARAGVRSALIVDENDKLVGIVTDGDVRRALIKHLPMDISVSEIMNKSPKVAYANQDRKIIMAMMQNDGIIQIPIVTEDNKVIGLQTLEDLAQTPRCDNPVFLMAGGFGKRLHPLTVEKPKPLLSVGDKPILQNILEGFIELGFYKFYISVHYKADQVMQYFGNGHAWGVEITYVIEESPLGTAGALGMLPSNLPDFPLIMMNGDLLTRLNYPNLLHFHNMNTADITMCVREYDFQVPYGVVQANGQHVMQIIEKPVHRFFVNAGIYVLNPEIVRSVRKNQAIDTPVFIEQKIKQNKKVIMFPVHEYWLDIGRIDDFNKAQTEAASFFSENLAVISNA